MGKMKIEERRLQDIKPYEKNPRKNDEAVEKVAASLREFGWQQPIVLDKDGVIIAGHTRLKAAEKLGLETAPCVIAEDLTEEEVRAYRLADNKTAELATWNIEKLDEELARISDIDMEALGFLTPSVEDFGEAFELSTEEKTSIIYHYNFIPEEWDELEMIIESSGYDPDDQRDRGAFAAKVYEEWMGQ